MLAATGTGTRMNPRGAGGNRLRGKGVVQFAEFWPGENFAGTGEVVVIVFHQSRRL